MTLEARVADPADVLILLKPLRQLQRVLGVPLGAQAQRLDAEQELLRREGAHAGAQVAQDLDAHAQDPGQRAEGVEKFQAVEARGRLVHLREARGRGGPVELAAVDDDAADGGAVAADPLGRAVQHDVGAVVERAAEVAAGAEGVVDDDGHALGVRDADDGLEVRHVVARVADALDVHGLGLGVDQPLEVGRVVAAHEAGLDAEARQ